MHKKHPLAGPKIIKMQIWASAVYFDQHMASEAPVPWTKSTTSMQKNVQACVCSWKIIWSDYLPGSLSSCCSNRKSQSRRGRGCSCLNVHWNKQKVKLGFVLVIKALMLYILSRNCVLYIPNSDQDLFFSCFACFCKTVMQKFGKTSIFWSYSHTLVDIKMQV